MPSDMISASNQACIRSLSQAGSKGQQRRRNNLHRRLMEQVQVQARLPCPLFKAELLHPPVVASTSLLDPTLHQTL